MIEIIPFAYQDSEVRTFTLDGQPWFVAADVVTILGVGRVQDSTRYLDEDEKGRCLVDTPSGEQVMITVNEPGLYSLILRSRKPEAKQFKRWITHEVLPAIRKHGGYLTPEATEKALSDPDFIIRLATNLKAERARVASLTAHVTELEPKAEGYDSLLSSEGTFSLGDVAKILGIGRQTLFNQLRAEKVLISGGDMRNTPYQHYAKHFKVRAKTFTTDDGRSHVTFKTYAKPSALPFIQRKLSLPPVQMPIPMGETA